ncbi:MAG TPA: MlaD family protein [Casimicrobiaceae bacterium]|nr:MlaD family protein [Casimicrobiaceae bacterium]
MSAQANFFKIGLFVIGATVALVVLLLILGSGQWFQSKVTMETYLNESVQGLEAGSKVRYRGVVVGEVRRIGFTYNVYEQDQPMSARLRYVMVEATILPRLIGGRAGGDITRADTAKIEIDRGLRVRLAPQGITGTNYLEIDYVDPKTNPILPITWTPHNLYIPSAQSTVTAFVAAASEIMSRLQKLDLEGTLTNLNRLLVTTNSRIEAIDTGKLSQDASRVLGKIDNKLDQLAMNRISSESVALLAELRTTNQRLAAVLDDPALKRLPGDTDAALVQLKKTLDDPNLTRSLAHLQNTLSRLDRLTGSGEPDLKTTFDNLRQITENLRDLSENAKRYPSQLLLGAPPAPAKGLQP